MKFMNTVITVVCISFGLFIGFYLLNGYDKKEKIQLANLDSERVFFFKYKDYDSIEEMENSVDLTDYIYTNENNKYTVYVAITQNPQNVDKIIGFFEKKGYVINKEEISISSKSFLDVLSQYDILLESTEKEDVIEAVIGQVLQKYEEAEVEN